MHDYFIKIVGQTKMLNFTIPEAQLVRDLMRHFPRYIQQAFVTGKTTTIIGTAEFLRSLDDVSKQEFRSNNAGARANEKKKNQTQQNYQNWRRPEAVEPRNTVAAMQVEDFVNLSEN